MDYTGWIDIVLQRNAGIFGLQLSYGQVGGYCK